MKHKLITAYCNGVQNGHTCNLFTKRSKFLFERLPDIAPGEEDKSTATDADECTEEMVDMEEEDVLRCSYRKKQHLSTFGVSEQRTHEKPRLTEWWASLLFPLGMPIHNSFKTALSTWDSGVGMMCTWQATLWYRTGMHKEVILLAQSGRELSYALLLTWSVILWNINTEFNLVIRSDLGGFALFVLIWKPSPVQKRAVTWLDILYIHLQIIFLGQMSV